MLKTLKISPTLLLLCSLISCKESTELESTDTIVETETTSEVVIDEIDNFIKSHPLPNTSKSIGTPGNGSLKNGALFPFYGANFQYFSKKSYLLGRGFVHIEIREILLNGLKSLESKYPGRMFYVMETSLEDGGKMEPHRTHRNGTSVDFMVPKIKDGLPNYKYDTTGVPHYALSFNDDGTLFSDPSISIDFDVLANVILELEIAARNEGWKISKIILKKELKDELYATDAGKKIQSQGIYITKNLSHVINVLHDDHIHIDFEKV